MEFRREPVDGVEWLLVVGLDAGEVALDDGAAGGAAFEQSGLGLGDGGADGVEGLGVGLGVRERRDGKDKQAESPKGPCHEGLD